MTDERMKPAEKWAKIMWSNRMGSSPQDDVIFIKAIQRNALEAAAKVVDDFHAPWSERTDTTRALMVDKVEGE